MQCSECTSNNLAECCCACLLPLPALCQQHAQRHSQCQGFHFLLPLSAVDIVLDEKTFYEARSWLHRLRDRQMALLQQVSLVVTFRTQVEKAYQEVVDQLCRLGTQQVLVLSSLQSSLQSEIDAAIQEVSEHALDTDWRPNSHFAKVLWNSEAADIATHPLTSFTIQSQPYETFHLVSVDLSCDVPGYEQFRVSTGQKNIRDQLNNLTEQLETAKTLLKSWLQQVQPRKSENALLQELLGTEIELPQPSDHPFLPDFSTIRSRATLNIVGPYRLDSASERLIYKPPVRMEDGSFYEGQWDLQSHRCGSGKQSWPNGDEYAGAWKDGKKHGKGRLLLGASGDVYEGDFENDKYHGFGTFQSFEGIRYKGEFLEGQKNGLGKLDFPETSESECYLGEFKADKKEGLGAYLWRSGAMYIGYWQQDSKHGLCLESKVGSSVEVRRYLQGDQTGCGLQ